MYKGELVLGPFCLDEILLGVRPVLARMPVIPCVFWGHMYVYLNMMKMLMKRKINRSAALIYALSKMFGTLCYWQTGPVFELRPGVPNSSRGCLIRALDRAIDLIIVINLSSQTIS